MSEPQPLPNWLQPEAAPASPAPKPGDLAGQLAGKLCHDFISPASAISSGLDLLDDPSAQDMRQDAMELIAGSARKLMALLEFSRAAFGATSGAESFDAKDLETLAQGVYAHVRPELVWDVAPASLDKVPARALLNLAQIGAAALAGGGSARLFAKETDTGLHLGLEATGPRVRLKAEVVAGLAGQPLPDGSMAGQWIQAYLLHGLVGGRMTTELTEERLAVNILLPT